MKMADEKVFHYKQGGGTSYYLHWENLYNLQGTGIMQRLMPIEEEIYRQTLPIQQKWYKQGKIDSKDLDALYERIGEYLISEGVID